MKYWRLKSFLAIWPSLAKKTTKHTNVKWLYQLKMENGKGINHAFICCTFVIFPPINNDWTSSVSVELMLLDQNVTSHNENIFLKNHKIYQNCNLFFCAWEKEWHQAWQQFQCKFKLQKQNSWRTSNSSTLDCDDRPQERKNVMVY